MLRSSHRNQRQKSPHAYGEQQTLSKPFFGGTNDIGIQRKPESTFFQAKLSVGKPGDKYEREADSVADAVVNNQSADTVLQQKKINGIQRQSEMEKEKPGTNDERMLEDKMIQEKPGIQTKCASCEKEEKKGIQRAPAGGLANTTNSAPHSLSNRIVGSSGRGKQLPAKTLSEMSSSFGMNFRGVNIHTGADAIQMNQELGAQAFTHGSDIYFNAGKFNPENSTGKRLLAHELTHVVQQTGSDQVQRSLVPNVQANCAGKSRNACWGNCTHRSGYPGTCRWSGSIANGCVCYENLRSARTLEDVLPSWIIFLLSAAALALLAACFATGVCEAAVIIGAAGATAGAVIIGIFRAAGVEVTGDEGDGGA